jgi:hypothetical protein
VTTLPTYNRTRADNGAAVGNDGRHSYSPDLAPTVQSLWTISEGDLQSDAEVKQAVIFCLQTFGSDFFNAGIQALFPQWDKRLNVSGDYLEVRSCTTC